MKIVIVTDAWEPQVNGVVRSLQSVRRELEQDGHEIFVISPDQYRSVPCPTYPEIRLAFTSSKTIGKRMAAFAPDAIHLSTEGPLCLSARRWCVSNKIDFTTAYHTQFPDYLAKRTGLPASFFWRYIRWFHHRAEHILVSTESVRTILRYQELHRLVHWGRGVYTVLFTPNAIPLALFSGIPRPIQLYVGRVAVEKNIEAFLQCDTPGSKVVVGAGPALAQLQSAYPEAHFLGNLNGDALAGTYAGADVFVFPSRTDTFGLVMIEALACGTPIAAYPVSGPVDIVTAETGALDENLAVAIARALTLDRSKCAKYGGGFNWHTSAGQFLAALVPVKT